MRAYEAMEILKGQREAIVRVRAHAKRYFRTTAEKGAGRENARSVKYEGLSRNLCIYVCVCVSFIYLCRAICGINRRETRARLSHDRQVAFKTFQRVAEKHSQILQIKHPDN